MPADCSEGIPNRRIEGSSTVQNLIQHNPLHPSCPPSHSSLEYCANTLARLSIFGRTQLISPLHPLPSSPRLNMATSGRGRCGCARDRRESLLDHHVGILGIGAGTDTFPQERQVQPLIVPNYRWTSSLGTQISNLLRRLPNTNPPS